MKTVPLKYLAALLTCGAMLAGGELSAQNQVTEELTEYAARPLPPLPPASSMRRFFDPTTPLPAVESNLGQSKTKTLFTVESPPVPPGYDVSARIVRPATVESVAPPVPAQTDPPELISSSAFKVTVESPTNFEPLPAVSTERVAELPEHLVTQNENAPGGFLVSFDNKSQAEDLEPALDSPAPDIDAVKTPELTIPDDISIDPDSFDEPEPEEDSDSEDDDRETEDLDDEEDEEEEDVQPKARQFGIWPKKSMQEVNADVRNFGGEVPTDESGVLIASTQRYYRSAPQAEKVFAWAAPKIRYQPLYFEDVQLERYGQTTGLIKQPVVSGFKFFRDAALLPLNASIDCPGSCDGPLGFCRPGAPNKNCGCSACQR